MICSHDNSSYHGKGGTSIRKSGAAYRYCRGFIAPDMVPFFTKLKTFFCCWGWMYIIGIFVAILFLLAYAGVALWTASSGQIPLHPFTP